jgi:hypothetical protein
MEGDLVCLLVISFGLILFCIHLLKKLEMIQDNLKYTENRLNIYKESYEEVNKTAKKLLNTCEGWRNIYDSLSNYHNNLLNKLEKQGVIEIVKETIH